MEVVEVTWWEKMGNLGSSLQGNVGIWREILEFREKLRHFVHKNRKIVFKLETCFLEKKKNIFLVEL